MNDTAHIQPRVDCTQTASTLEAKREGVLAGRIISPIREGNVRYIRTFEQSRSIISPRSQKTLSDEYLTFYNEHKQLVTVKASYFAEKLEVGKETLRTAIARIQTDKNTSLAIDSIMDALKEEVPHHNLVPVFGDAAIKKLAKKEYKRILSQFNGSSHEPFDESIITKGTLFKTIIVALNELQNNKGSSTFVHIKDHHEYTFIATRSKHSHLDLTLCDFSKKLGEGGFGTAYRAFSFNTMRSSAVKKAHAYEQINDPEMRAISRERAAADIMNEHEKLKELHKKGRVPGIQAPLHTVFHVGGDDSATGHIGELYDGDLRTLTKLSSHTIFGGINQLLIGLSHFSSHDFFHGDIKPENCFIKMREDGQIQCDISDIGSCRSLKELRQNFEEAKQNKEPSIAFGSSTRDYLPHSDDGYKAGDIEQFIRYNRFRDVYALGKTLKETFLPALDKNHPAYGSLSSLINYMIDETQEQLPKAEDVLQRFQGLITLHGLNV